VQTSEGHARCCVHCGDERSRGPLRPKLKRFQELHRQHNSPTVPSPHVMHRFAASALQPEHMPRVLSSTYSSGWAGVKQIRHLGTCFQGISSSLKSHHHKVTYSPFISQPRDRSRHHRSQQTARVTAVIHRYPRSAWRFAPSLSLASGPLGSAVLAGSSALGRAG
jgi:hypothetical protein